MGEPMAAAAARATRWTVEANAGGGAAGRRCRPTVAALTPARRELTAAAAAGGRAWDATKSTHQSSSSCHA
ncbi:hypothetical protein Taro_019727 [Colocasia esculenta]|uniref:Uncharacterized protein n=1 Tax=Colocasia esculenta TaxID=4460 RepID=A0A843UUM1_COLES|nr:hypothetical protein [Colocasia esculenta]